MCLEQQSWLRALKGIRQRMSLWNRRKSSYTVTRRQSNPNPDRSSSAHNSPVPRRTSSRVPNQRPEARLSRSLVDLSESAPPPPLPPRRQAPSPAPPPLQFRSPGAHLEFPPPSVLPVLERNAAVRHSRLLSPFVYIHFGEPGGQSLVDSAQSSSVLRNLNSPRGYFPTAAQSQSLLLQAQAGMNFMPSWIPAPDDEPPSYEEALKMDPVTLSSDNKEPSSAQKRFVKETAV